MGRASGKRHNGGPLPQIWALAEQKPGGCPAEPIEAARQLSQKERIGAEPPVTDTVAAILKAHRSGALTPADTVARSFARIRAHNDPAVFISLRPEAGPEARLTGGQALLRRFVEGLGEMLIGLGALTMLGDPQRRTWGDKASGTAVIRDRTPQPGTKKGLKVSSYATAGTAAIVVALVAATTAGGTGQSSNNAYTATSSSNGYDNTTSSTDTSSGPSPSDTSSSDSSLTDSGTATQDPTAVATSDAVPAVIGTVVTGHFVHERPATDPTSGGEDKVLPSETSVTIVCQTTGAVVDNDNVWYRLADGYYVVAQFMSVPSAPASC